MQKKLTARAYQPERMNLAQILGNPLRNFTAASLTQILEAAMRGEWTQLQWLLMHAELRDPDLMALQSYRLGALTEMDWQIKVSEKAETLGLEGLAEQQRETLLAHYERFENLYAAIRHLGLATFRGYSHVVIRGEEIEPLEQIWFVRDGQYGDWFWNPEARFVPAQFFDETARVEPEHFIIREVPHSLAHYAALKYLYTTFGHRWWASYCDAISKQGVVVIGPPEVSDEQRGEFIAAAEKIALGASGVLPNGANMIQPNATRGPNIFEPWLRYLAEKLVLAGTGGKLTMLNDAVGIGGGQSGTHAETFRTLARAEAQEISEIFQRQLDAPYLEAHYPGVPVLAYFELCFREQQDTSAYIDDLAKLAAAGYRVPADEVARKTGYPVELAPPPAPAATPFTFRAPAGSDSLANRTADALTVDAAWLAPVADLLAEIEQAVSDGDMTYADLAEYLQRAAARVPELFAKMDIDAFADVLARALGEAAAQGLKAAAEER